METCNKCKGGGLIGNGHEPWLLQGHVVTCPDCTGTGKVATPVSAIEPAVAPESTETVASIGDVVPKHRGGILGVIDTLLS